TTTIPNATQLASFVPPLSPDNATGTSFGGFAGYNTQWESAVLGLEVGYHSMSLNTSGVSSASFGVAARFRGDNAFNVDMSEGSSIHLNDYAPFRGRGGWAFGCFLPYVTLGLAVGRADITNNARLHFVEFDGTGAVTADVSVPITEVRHDQFNLGLTTGLGI